MRIRLALADDHALVREGLSKSFQQEEDMEVVGQAGDGHEAVELARELQPDILMMDISMPGLNGSRRPGRSSARRPGARSLPFRCMPPSAL